MFKLSKKFIPYFVILTCAILFGGLFMSDLLENIEFVITGRIIALRTICGWIAILCLAIYLLLYFYRIFMPARGEADIKSKGYDMIWQIFIIGGVISDWLYYLFFSGEHIMLHFWLGTLLIILTMVELNLTFDRDRYDDF